MARKNDYFLKNGYQNWKENTLLFTSYTTSKHIDIIDLGLGNPRFPISRPIADGVIKKMNELTKPDGFIGYQTDIQGNIDLRIKISTHYNRLGAKVNHNEIFITDGSHSVVSNIFSLFSRNSTFGFQTLTYPGFIENLKLNPIFTTQSNYKKRVKFFNLGDLRSKTVIESVTRVNDILTVCFPQNPTGIMPTKSDLQNLINSCIRNKCILIYDTAYSSFISDTKTKPLSIYELENADKCAIEITSLSKSHSLAGLRIGWVVVPMKLELEDSEYGEINSLWRMKQENMFFGVSHLSQEAALFALEGWGIVEAEKTISYYRQNALILKSALERKGFTVIGGEDCPFLWVNSSNNLHAEELFKSFYVEFGVIVSPGNIFGIEGNHHIRINTMCLRSDIEKIILRLNNEQK